MLVAQVDNAEPITVWIFQHYEVRILRVAVPVDPPGTERHETRGFCLLLADIRDVQVKVQARVSLRRGLAELEGYRRAGLAWWHKHPRPSAEPILAQLVAQRRRPEFCRSLHIGGAQGHHAEPQHGPSVATRIPPEKVAIAPVEFIHPATDPLPGAGLGDRRDGARHDPALSRVDTSDSNVVPE